MSRETVELRGADALGYSGRQQDASPSMGKGGAPLARSKTTACPETSSAREPGDLQLALPGVEPGELDREADEAQAGTRRLEKSDGSVVPRKPPNKATGGPPEAAEGVEGRDPAKGKHAQNHPHRTQTRVIEGQTGLARVGEKAREEGGKKEKDKEKFTNLFTHLRVDLLTAVYHRLNKSAAAGVDGRTWAEYGQGLHERLVDLQGRLHRGAYHPQPVLRRYIPKADGRMRPLGIPAIEDKIVQGAVVTLLTPIYEAEFRECSFGFRPHRNQHQALEAVDRMMYQGKVDWVLDADIRSFFDKLDQDWLVRMVEHRIGDRRLVRLIRKWLKAGVMEDAKLLATEEGTPQGGLISPLLANIYLHYVLDLWFAKEAKQLSGTAHLVRFADDFIAGFQKQEEVEAFRRRLEQRMREFHLELHPEKTRTLRFGCFAQKDCHKDGIDKPETFDFLGFTHICGKTARGKFRLVRRTSKKKRKAKMADLREKLRRWVYLPLNEQWQRLCSVLRGHYQYYGLSTNFRALHSFARRLRLVWHKQLQRRSQRAHMTRAKLDRLDRLFPLPRPRILGFQRVLCFSP